MPACLVGCCPETICDCSTGCECLLPVIDSSLFPDSFHGNLKKPQKAKPFPRLICPCRNKDETLVHLQSVDAKESCCGADGGKDCCEENKGQNEEATISTTTPLQSSCSENVTNEHNRKSKVCCNNKEPSTKESCSSKNDTNACVDTGSPALSPQTTSHKNATFDLNDLKSKTCCIEKEPTTKKCCNNPCADSGSSTLPPKPTSHGNITDNFTDSKPETCCSDKEPKESCCSSKDGAMACVDVSSSTISPTQDITRDTSDSKPKICCGEKEPSTKKSCCPSKNDTESCVEAALTISPAQDITRDTSGLKPKTCCSEKEPSTKKSCCSSKNGTKPFVDAGTPTVSSQTTSQENVAHVANESKPETCCSGEELTLKEGCCSSTNGAKPCNDGGFSKISPEKTNYESNTPIPKTCCSNKGKATEEECCSSKNRNSPSAGTSLHTVTPQPTSQQNATHDVNSTQPKLWCSNKETPAKKNCCSKNGTNFCADSGSPTVSQENPTHDLNDSKAKICSSEKEPSAKKSCSKNVAKFCVDNGFLTISQENRAHDLNDSKAKICSSEKEPSTKKSCCSKNVATFCVDSGSPTISQENRTHDLNDSKAKICSSEKEPSTKKSCSEYSTNPCDNGGSTISSSQSIPQENVTDGLNEPQTCGDKESTNVKSCCSSNRGASQCDYDCSPVFSPAQHTSKPDLSESKPEACCIEEAATKECCFSFKNDTVAFVGDGSSTAPLQEDNGLKDAKSKRCCEERESCCSLENGTDLSIDVDCCSNTSPDITTLKNDPTLDYDVSCSSPNSPEESVALVTADVNIVIDELRVQTTKLRVQNICCPKESYIADTELRKLDGVKTIKVNTFGRVVYVSHNPEVVSPIELMTALNKRHLGASIVETGAEEELDDGLPKSLKIMLIFLAVQTLLFATALGTMFSHLTWFRWVAIVEICFGIAPVLQKCFYAIRNRTIDLNMLITITVIGTLVIQEWIEGAAVVFVFTLANVLQQFCFYRVQKTISSLMLSRPSKAVIASTGDCIPIEQVAVGSVIAVRQGELIPLDGIVVKGSASVDESTISGEAVPVEKTLQSQTYSGTVIQHGYLELETTSSSTSSTMSKISAMVEEAQMNISPTEMMVNKFAKYYTPLVVVLAVLVFIIPLVLGLSGVDPYEGATKTWGERALIVLVTACPCALLMATPIVVICGISGAARLGTLIKGGTFLEALSQLTFLAFDKTGTLTEGKFQVVDLLAVDKDKESDVLRWAAALESKSSHPLAAAVVTEYTGECIADFAEDAEELLPDVSDFRTMEGQGISGIVEGHRVEVGNYSLLRKLGLVLSPEFDIAYNSFCSDSKTVVFVCVDGDLALLISLADIIREDSYIALEWLQDLGIHLAMLTGDSEKTATAVQNELKLDSFVSEMKPDDKLRWIAEIKEKETLRNRRWFSKNHVHVVGMVGDGVNDGPALAVADVGVAMAAGGSALAVEAAGVALMTNSVLKVPEMICLSRFCRRLILQNIVLAVFLKLVFVVIALTGFVRVWMAVVADLVGLLVVIVNGLRPLKWKPPRTTVEENVAPRASWRRKRPNYQYESVV